jgi:energy-coupling factor transporter ATP-binding protein EcfA2
MIDFLKELELDTELFGLDAPCPIRIEQGSNQRVLLITGGNASGKSFVCRYLNEVARDGDNPPLFMRIGMGKRTESGITRALMFGDEDRESTGLISSNCVSSGISTCRSKEAPHCLCLDEPDIGLSEEMQHAMGAILSDFAADLPVHTLGLIVVTHSRPIAQQVLGVDPLRIRVGDDLRTTQD